MTSLARPTQRLIVALGLSLLGGCTPRQAASPEASPTEETLGVEYVAPSPLPSSPRPADPTPEDALVRYNLDLLNQYRATKGVAPLLYDAQISAFAMVGSEQLSRDHEPHAHYRASVEGAPGFGSRSGENQGDAKGVKSLSTERVGEKEIAKLMKDMFDEGPKGGHYRNMMNPKYRRVGFGILESGKALFLTNDFSD
jgi:uncharacterized protein YkwD